jgi:hypothetical protein
MKKNIFNIVIFSSKHICHKIIQNKAKTMFYLTISYFLLKYYLNKASIDEYIDLKLADPSFVPGEEQFIMYRCEAQADKNRNCGGLGDRIKGITSAYLWGILTNRTFLIRIDRPCEFDRLYQPNKVDWNGRRDEKFGYFEKIEITGDDWFKDRFSRANFTLMQQKRKLIIFKSNRNLAESIAKNKNPNIYNKVKMLGFEPEKFDLPYTFRYIYNHLFKLTPHLEKKYQEFLAKAKPTNDSVLICAQVRIGGYKHFYYRNYFDLNSQKVENSKRYWNIIKEKLLPNINHNNFKIFITTDNQLVHDDALKEFGSDKIVYHPGPFNHVDYIENTKDDCTNSEKAILDFHSLQNCDMAVISRSQFGRIGLWNRKNPLKEVYAYNTDKEKFFKWEHFTDLHVI